MKQVKFIRTIPPNVKGDVATYEEGQLLEDLLTSRAVVYYPPLPRKSEEPEDKGLDAPPKDKMVQKREIKTKGVT